MIAKPDGPIQFQSSDDSTKPKVRLNQPKPD